jgi:trigger factor
LSPIESKADCTREILVEVPADVVSHEQESLIGKYQKMAHVPGFRRGKVPASVIRQRFAENLNSEVAENLIPRYLQQEVDKQGLHIVSKPQVSDLHLHEGEPLRFKATFEIMPEFEISGYEDVAPQREEIVVTDEEIAEQLGKLREEQATYSAVEGRPAQPGDYAQISFTGSPRVETREAGDSSGQPPAASKDAPPPVKVDEVLVELGGSNTVREFSDNLTGVVPGDERKFAVSYPQDFSDERLAGTTFEYVVSVKGVKQKLLPELNDDLARQVGDFENLAALQDRVRQGIHSEKEHRHERDAKEKIIERLLERNAFPVPDSLIEEQVDVQLKRGMRALVAQGMRPEDLKNVDLLRLRSGQHETALKSVRASLILDRIADREKIDATDEEVNHEVEVLARQSKLPVEEVRERLTQDGALDRIRGRLRNEKTLDHLFRRTV